MQGPLGKGTIPLKVLIFVQIASRKASKLYFNTPDFWLLYLSFRIFPSSRELRKSDLVPTLRFILVIEVLSKMIDKAVMGWRLLAFQVLGGDRSKMNMFII